MTTLAKPADFKKEYLPGYTGHVPSKNERFGATTGQIKREILSDRGKHPIVLQKNRMSHDDPDRLYSDKFTPSIDKNKEVFGNLSRFAKNWVCGPNHMIRAQRVPGYTGHIKGLVSENLHASSYGNLTSRAIGKKHPVGHDVVPRERFLSFQTSQYKPKNFRRFVEKPYMQPRKDYDDYSRFINDSFSDTKVEMLSQSLHKDMRSDSFNPLKQTCNPLLTLKTYSDVPQITSFNRTGFNTTKNQGRNMSTSYMNQTTTDHFNVDKQLHGQFNGLDVKPQVLESKVSKKEDFFNLSNGFKQVFAKDKSDMKMVMPIAGYGGHRRGDRSQNFFGKSFRETSLQSKRLQRHLRTSSVV